MKISLIRWSWVLLFATSPAFGEGATTVGDGGHVVICSSASGMPTIQLLDLFEAEVLGYRADIVLGTRQTELLSKVRIGLDRLVAYLKLSRAESKQLMLAADRFVRFPYDPWKRAKNGGPIYVIKAQDPTVNRLVYNEFARRNCHLETVVIHPDPENKNWVQRQIYENICLAGVNGIKNCFLTNTIHLKSMSYDERACLIVHEALRFLPKEKKFRHDADLRRATVFACTGR